MRGAPSEDHVRLDPAESLIREVGAQLRQRRLERGVDLEDVAKELRIRPNYLFAIEQGDLAALPGRPYALGFLRSYAQHLGFDGDDLVTRIKAAVEDLTDRTRLRIRMPLPEHRLPKTPVVVISLAVVVGIYAGWSYVNRSSRTVVDTVAEVPGEMRDPTFEAASSDRDQDMPVAGAAGSQPSAEGDIGPEASPESERAGADPAAATAAAEAPSAPVTPQAGPAASETVGVALSGERGALAVQPAAGRAPAETIRASTGRDVAAVATAPGSAADGAADRLRTAERASPSVAGGARAMEVLASLDPAAGTPGGPQVFERSHSDARVILRARERSWIEVSSLSGDYRFQRTLEAGEAVLVPNRSDLELWTGNAGGLEVVVDGRPVPVLAQGGAVQRHVSLDPARLLAPAADQP